MPPRGDKKISQGSLSEPIVSARARVWTKYGGPENADQFEPDGQVTIDPLTQATVEVDLTAEAPTVEVSKPEPAPVFVPKPVEYEWTSERSVEGRVYHRKDGRSPVEASA